MKNQSTSNGFVILTVANILSKLISLAYVPMLSRIFNSDATYGIYSAAFTIYSYIYIVGSSGMPIGISKLVTEHASKERFDDVNKIFKISLRILTILGAVLAFGMFFLAEPISTVLNSPGSKYAIMTLSPTILFTCIMSAYKGYFQGRRNMIPTAVASILEQVFNVAFSLTFAHILINKSVELGVMGATIGTTIGAMVAVIFLVVVFKYYKKKELSLKEPNLDVKRNRAITKLKNKVLFQTLLRYSIPVTISTMIYNGGIYISDLFIVKRNLDMMFSEKESIAMFGILSKFNTISSVPLIIILSLSTAVLPSIAYSFAQNDIESIIEKVKSSIRTTLMIAIPSAFGMAALGKEIYRVILGVQNYELGAKIIVIGGAVVVFMALEQITATILQSIGKFNVTLVSITLGIIIKIILCYFLTRIPQINIFGTIISSIFCFLISTIINCVTINKQLKMNLNLNIVKQGFTYILSSAIMAVVIIIIKRGVYFLIGDGVLSMVLVILICVFIGIFIYMASLIYTGGITKKYLNSFPSKLVKIIPSFLLVKIK